MRRLLLGWLLVLATLGMAMGSAGASESKPLVAVALAYNSPERWTKDLGAMRDYAAARDIRLLVEVAENNQMQQNQQVTRLLSLKPDVLILTPQDAAGAASVVKKARELGVKVISYDRLVLNAEVDLYVSFDNELVGEMQASYLTRGAPAGDYIILSGSPIDNNSRLFLSGAKKILDPLVDGGQIKVAVEEPVIDWRESEARAIVERALKRGLRPVAVLAPNDITAQGVVTALEEYGLDGRVLVSGQDAEAAAARRIWRGAQAMTVFKDTRLLGAKAMEMAIKIAAGQSLADDVDGHIQSGSWRIPTVRLAPVMVDRGNLKSVLLDSGFLSAESVFGPGPENSPAADDDSEKMK